ncbi:hypothetical protein KKB28_10130, partial [bacterium]|nr:hypothetical protein [bacterium]
MTLRYTFLYFTRYKGILLDGWVNSVDTKSALSWRNKKGVGDYRLPLRCIKAGCLFQQKHL